MPPRRIYDPKWPNATVGCPACGADLSWAKPMDLRFVISNCRCHRHVHADRHELRCRGCKRLVIVAGKPGELIGLELSSEKPRNVVGEAAAYEARFRRLERRS